MNKMLSYYKKYIPLLLVIVAFLFGQALCELALPGYMSNIINNGIVKQDMSYIWTTGALMLAVAFGSIVFAALSNLVASRVSAAASKNIRGALFKRVTSFSFRELNEFSTASLITRSTNDIQTVQQTSVLVFRFAFYAPIMGIGALVKALRTSPSLTWTIGLALVIILCIMAVLFLLVFPKFNKLQLKLDKLNLIIGERLAGLLVVRAFNSEKQEEERFDKVNKDLTKINVFVNRGMSFMFPALMLIMNLTSVLVVWFGAKMIDSGNLMIGDMLAFLQYSMQVIMAFLFITMMFIMIPRAAVSGRRISQVLKVLPTIEDPPFPKKPEVSKGLIEFKNVSFSFADAEEKTLSNISFTAKPGETTAIIGGTGSGKSSLVSLIPRFFDVTRGSIELDGIDIRNMNQKTLREKIGFVPQKGLLFSGTIASNLRYGKSDASIKEMEEAAETAQALSFISALKEGFDTPVSQGGTSVSGGQKQRLSIARALIKKPNVYIFDDSFSALDFKTDATLRKALKEKVGGSTFIIVAQRVNTIMNAEQIIVLDNGKIVGKGSHKELLTSCPIYKEIASSQLSEEELEKEGL